MLEEYSKTTGFNKGIWENSLMRLYYPLMDTVKSPSYNYNYFSCCM